MNFMGTKSVLRILKTQIKAGGETMTKKTLEEAVKLQEKIQYFREKKKNHEKAEEKCGGNFSDVASRNFFIEITNSYGEVAERVHVSANSARKALNAEINIDSKILAKLEQEFDELH